MRKNFFTTLLFLLLVIFSTESFLHAEDVNLSTYYPAPYGSYKQLQVQEDSRSLKTDFTQAVTRAGINIITTYNANNFTPGIFWSTSGAANNPDRPKAGIWMQMNAAGTGSLLYFGTSNNFGTGITNDGIVLDQDGSMAISGQLKVALTALTASNDQGGSMELGGNGTTANPELGGRPYIDFHYGRGVAEDFNARVINQDDGVLDIVTRVGGAAAQTRLSVGTSVGVGTAAPSASAALDVSSTTGGFLLPRMTQAQRNAIAAPATGLLVYQTNSSPGFYYYTGTAWTALGAGAAPRIEFEELAANTVYAGTGQTTLLTVSFTATGGRPVFAIGKMRNRTDTDGAADFRNLFFLYRKPVGSAVWTRVDRWVTYNDANGIIDEGAVVMDTEVLAAGDYEFQLRASNERAGTTRTALAGDTKLTVMEF